MDGRPREGEGEAISSILKEQSVMSGRGERFLWGGCSLVDMKALNKVLGG